MALKTGIFVLAVVALATSVPQLGGRAGGERVEDPSDPEYYKLAQESLAQFVSSSGTKQYPKPVEIQKVVTQVVAGTITKIDFTASITNCEVTSDGVPNSSSCDVQDPDNVIQCHAQIWERPWLNKKEIDIKCLPVAART